MLNLPYKSWNRRLGLRHEFNRLKESLQLRHGTHVLQETKLIVTNPVERSVALDTYKLNYAKPRDELGVVCGRGLSPCAIVEERHCKKIDDTSEDLRNECRPSDRPNLSEYVHSSGLICEENEPVQRA